jgi:HK97 family phage prohead protease
MRTMRKYSLSEFRKLARLGKHPADAVIERPTTADPQPQGGRKIRFTFSDGSVDRQGDMVAPGGWDLTEFRRNPVALFSHDASSPPIGKASNVAVVAGQLIGDIEFPTADVYALADTILKLIKGGFMKACSVGFQPIEFKMANDPARPLGINFLRQKLLEISVCSVPANPNALALAAVKGIDTRPLERMRIQRRENRVAQAKKIAAEARRFLRE